MKIGGDECTPLRGSHKLAVRRINQRVRVEKKLLRSKRKIINRSQQRPVVKDTGAGPNDGLPTTERIVSDGCSWTEIVHLINDGFLFLVQTLTLTKHRPYSPLIL